jgi:hypothetical protein
MRIIFTYILHYIIGLSATAAALNLSDCVLLCPLPAAVVCFCPGYGGREYFTFEAGGN